MNEIPPQFRSIVKGSKEKDMTYLLYHMWKTIPISYEELLELPLPTFKIICEEMEREVKETEKAYKKARMRR